MLLKLKSIEEEAADCRAAFAELLVGALALHLHHDVLVEALVEPAEARIRYILESKKPGERLLRLRLFRPVPPECISPQLAKASAELDKASAEWTKARAERDKASAEWAKASAGWVKASAELDKASAEWDKASAELDKASAEWDKARAERTKARAEWDKASAEWEKTGRHAAVCPHCPWDGKTIFPAAKEIK